MLQNGWPRVSMICQKEDQFHASWNFVGSGRPVKERQTFEDFSNEYGLESLSRVLLNSNEFLVID